MILFVVLFLLWVILNGKLTLEICIFGIVLSAALTLFSRKFLDYDKHEKHSLKYYGYLIRYGLILLVEIVKANIAVLKIAYARRLNFQPAMVYFTADLKKESSLVMLSNSITITPGTITVMMNNGKFCVHCLDKSLGEGIDKSVFVEQLKRMEEV